MKKYAREEQHFLVNVGLNIRRLRILNRASQQHIAALCESEKATISRIETGKTNLTAMTAKKIADALGVPISQLFALQ